MRATGSSPISQNRFQHSLSDPESVIKPRPARIFQMNPAGMARI
jgi:hypothetical protein